MKDFVDFSLKEYNTFGIDVRCSRFVEYESLDELLALLPEVRSAERVVHIGGGSNLLFTADFEGMVLHSGIRDVEAIASEGDDVLVRVGAGVVWDDFVSRCVEQGLYGLENLSLIPGEVGASAVQNIGAYGSEAGDFIESVETIDIATGQVLTLRGDECQYAYRSSIFKTSLRGQRIITHVIYRLSRLFRPQLSYAALRSEVERRGLLENLTAADVRRIVVEVRREKLPEPSEVGSAGSFFMNPVVERPVFERIAAQYPDAPHYDLPDGSVKVPAGWLIQQCGWRGRNLGRAGVWPKQALVLVNLGGATGQDIVELCQRVQHDVLERFGIQLKPEVIFV